MKVLRVSMVSDRAVNMFMMLVANNAQRAAEV